MIRDGMNSSVLDMLSDVVYRRPTTSFVPPTDEDVTCAVSRAPFIDFEISVMDWFISAMAEAVVVEISIVRSLILRFCVMSLIRLCLNYHNLANSWHAATKHHHVDLRV